MAARGIGGATDRDSLSTRDANGATMLMEEDTAAVTKLLLVWLVIEVLQKFVREVCEFSGRGTEQ